MKVIAEMYISLLPVIIAAALNMVWCKLHFWEFLRKPIDKNKVLKDGKRLFGENKTWKGFVGLIVLGILCTTLWGIICANSTYLEAHNYLYRNYENSFLYNLLMGACFGLAYALFELPNSFIKRRLNIQPGKSKKSVGGLINIFIDQVDSIVGCVLVLSLVYKVSLLLFVGFILLGAVTHIVVNLLLYSLHLRKNMF